jgi:alpha-galactosidase
MIMQCAIPGLTALSLLVISQFLCASGVRVAAGQVTSPASVEEKHWTLEHLISVETHPPFSFVFSSRPSKQLLSSWPKTTSVERLDSNRTQHTVTWKDPGTGLLVRCVGVEFKDFPVVEWTVYFRNSGTANTPILEKIEGIDTEFSTRTSGPGHLHYIDGDGEIHGHLQFAPQVKTLRPSVALSFSPLAGRPTDGCFPYYNLQWGSRGVIFVLGWPGEWSSSFTSDAYGNVHILGGQQLTHLTLHPGEEIRSPRVALLFWRGSSWIDGQNLWRRWMLVHNMPQPGGKVVPVIRAGGGFLYEKLGWGGPLLNENDQVALMDRYHQEEIKLNTWWIDILGAGTWKNYSDTYSPRPQPSVVSWDTDRARFPGGLLSVSNRARLLGEKLLVWIEPEHVWVSNILFKEHPEWLLRAPDDSVIRNQINQGVILGNRSLLNLGNPAALRWMTDRLITLIADEKIGIYRQDFNITPLLFWQHNDAVDRQGMTENLYVQGYLRLLDTLHGRFPDLLIDTCASGGRRDDLETLRRAVPLWRSDTWGPDVVLQDQTYGLALWVPYFGTGTHATSPYAYRSSLGSSLMTSWDVRDQKLDYKSLRKLEAEFWRTAPFFKGDYYPLTPFSAAARTWMAWEFNRPEHGDGMVQAFRRDQADQATGSFRLHNLDARAQYAVSDLDESNSFTASGKDLMNKGLLVQIRSKPGASVIVYTRTK